MKYFTLAVIFFCLEWSNDHGCSNSHTDQTYDHTTYFLDIFLPKITQEETQFEHDSCKCHSLTHLSYKLSWLLWKGHWYYFNRSNIQWIMFQYPIISKWNVRSNKSKLFSFINLSNRGFWYFHCGSADVKIICKNCF